jgi:hypothetical protein
MLLKTMKLIPRSWFNLPEGWYAFDGFQVCSSSAVHFIDATTRYLVTEWPYRTTVAYHDTHGWQVIELCEKLFNMDERAAPITGSYARLLTILSKEVLTVSQFGMVISDAQFIQKVMDVKGHQVQVFLMQDLVQVMATMLSLFLQFNPNDKNNLTCRWMDQHCLRLLRLKLTDQW